LEDLRVKGRALLKVDLLGKWDENVDWARATQDELCTISWKAEITWLAKQVLAS
jgi:hypothetical protein